MHFRSWLLCKGDQPFEGISSNDSRKVQRASFYSLEGGLRCEVRLGIDFPLSAGSMFQELLVLRLLGGGDFLARISVYKGEEGRLSEIGWIIVE
eukprot:scaffold63452_cov26-Attheya_sp.AAC.2